MSNKNQPMNRNNKKALNTSERFHALGESAGQKGTYGDYLRLLEFYRETRGEQAREIVVRWVESEGLLT